MIYYDFIPSPIGQLLVTSNGDKLTGLYLENHKGGPSIEPSWVRDAERFASVRDQLADYFDGGLTRFDQDLDLEGTEFQRAVWDLLLEIPYGETVSYGYLAKRLGAPHASRAVGAAVGRNPISIIVPCHRVVGSGGAITGYAGGVERKKALLKLEQAALL